MMLSRRLGWWELGVVLGHLLIAQSFHSCLLNDHHKHQVWPSVQVTRRWGNSGRMQPTLLAQVPRFDATTMRREDFVVYESGHPIVFTHVLEHGEGWSDEDCCDTLLSTLGRLEVDYMVKDYGKGALKTSFFSSTLFDFVERLQVHSCHRQGWYLLSEDLLDSPSVDPRLRHHLRLPRRLFSEDLFGLFPAPVRPKQSCIIVGGIGARSHLHADPFEWVGVNYLLEGRKRWIFLPPTAVASMEREKLLKPRRVPPAAWDGGQDYNVSAGWVSDLDLYRQSELPDNDQHLWEGALEVVQEEGELVVIPPGWWHQVYHLEPSFCIASQYVNLDNLPIVLRHMMEWCGLSGESLESQLAACTKELARLQTSAHNEDVNPSSSKVIEDIIGRVIKQGIKYRRDRG